MMRLALKSLKDQKQQAVMYFLSLVFACSEILVYFNITAAQDAFRLTGESDYMIVGLSFYILVLSCAMVLSANQLFSRSKARELALRSSLGISQTSISLYLILQVLILFAAATILSLLVSTLVLKGLQLYFPDSVVFEISAFGNIGGIGCILFLAGWAALLNVSFTYINSAAMLLNASRSARPVEYQSMVRFGNPTEESEKRKQIMSRVLWFILFLAPAALIHTGSQEPVLFCGISIYAFWRLLHETAEPLLKLIGRKRAFRNARNMITGGMYRYDLQFYRFIIFLIFMNGVFLHALFPYTEGDMFKQHLIQIVYALSMLQIVFLLIVTFRSEAGVRNAWDHQLEQLGFEKKDLFLIHAGEIFLLVLTVTLCTLGYVAVICRYLSSEGIIRQDVLVNACAVFAALMAVFVLTHSGVGKKVKNV